MKNNIKTKLLGAFFVMNAALLISSIGLFAMHTYVVNKYSDVVNSMSLEYQLSQSVSNLIDEYNNLVLGNSTEVLSNNHKVMASEDQINQKIKLLDAAIVDPTAKVSFLGLKNSIEAVITEVNNGLADVAKDKATSFAHYQAAHHNYDFVQTNSTAFTFDQLKYVSAAEAKLQSTYTTLAVIAGSLLVVLLVGTTLFGVRFASKLITPLSDLTDIATRIASDNTTKVVLGPHLLNRTDEIGSLSNSLNVMLERLKEKISELAVAKTNVERKVEERTKQLSDAEAELTASVSSLPFGFALINVRNEIVFSNASLSALLDRKIPANPDKSRQELEKISADFHEAIDLLGCIHEVQIKKQPLERNVQLGPQYFRFVMSPIRSGSKILGTVMTMEDTSNERAMERSRDEFFSIASHELRTPLTAVRGNAEMMLEYYREQLKDPSLNEMVTDIHDASIRLIQIVNDFLDVSRLEQGKIVFKNAPFDPIELGKSILRAYEVTGSRQKIKLKSQPPSTPLPKAFADSDRARQIIINLISNGLKFTESGSIIIHYSVVGKHIHISVTDTGKGIPEASQHLLFHKFQQASNNLLTRDNTRSTGLGLYISRLMAEGMAGKLYLESSEEGKGSTFTLELPVAGSSK